MIFGGNMVFGEHMFFGLLLVLKILMKAASYTWAAMYMIDETALTRRF